MLKGTPQTLLGTQLVFRSVDEEAEGLDRGQGERADEEYDGVGLEGELEDLIGLKKDEVLIQCSNV